MALLYIQPIGCHQRIYQLKLGFCLFSLLCCHHSLIHPECRRAPANGRAGLQNLSPLGSCTGRGRIRFLGSARCDCSTIFIMARPSSKSSDAVRCLQHCLLHSVYKTVFVLLKPFVFPKAKAQYVHCYLIHCLIMFSDIMILSRLVTCMVEQFMLDLVLFMI